MNREEIWIHSIHEQRETRGCELRARFLTTHSNEKRACHGVLWERERRWPEKSRHCRHAKNTDINSHILELSIRGYYLTPLTNHGASLWWAASWRELYKEDCIKMNQSKSNQHIFAQHTHASDYNYYPHTRTIKCMARDHSYSWSSLNKRQARDWAQIVISEVESATITPTRFCNIM